ncbi:hypothetical protein QAD02_013119 [Eretmocerus hayati]|uniref:Uncharacterized protein n=1 Tax=Eretmocerus hayati TaxID=131215 RepID=A0ACC2P1S2_9HYME|nr:hypothetical protein QAD02_013119 [Eretmocerus hayati]
MRLEQGQDAEARDFNGWRRYPWTRMTLRLTPVSVVGHVAIAQHSARLRNLGFTALIAAGAEWLLTTVRAVGGSSHSRSSIWPFRDRHPAATGTRDVDRTHGDQIERVREQPDQSAAVSQPESTPPRSC